MRRFGVTVVLSPFFATASAELDPWNSSQLLFMRHGHVHYTAGGIGPLDPALFPTLDNYWDTANMFRDESSWPDMILVSPMRRTVQTKLWAFQYALAGSTIPIVEDGRIEEVPCTDGVYLSDMGTPYQLRDANITNLQDIEKTYVGNLSSNAVDTALAQPDGSWANRRLIVDVAGKERSDARQYMGIVLPGIGYADFTQSSGATYPHVTTANVDEWLNWANPQGARYCGDNAQQDSAAKLANLKSWFAAWVALNPGKRLAVVTHSWLLKALDICHSSRFMATRAVNATWDPVANCTGGRLD